AAVARPVALQRQPEAQVVGPGPVGALEGAERLPSAVHQHHREPQLVVHTLILPLRAAVVSAQVEGPWCARVRARTLAPWIDRRRSCASSGRRPRTP
ncbi:hypothetical protein B7486_55735, partial [cyanobacterium TDX16]